MDATNNQIDVLAALAREAREELEQKVALYHIGKVTYEDLTDAAKRMSNRFYDYQVAKYPKKKHRRVSYQTLIRNVGG
jgi:hypothetical protein